MGHRQRGRAQELDAKFWSRADSSGVAVAAVHLGQIADVHWVLKR